MREIKFRAWDGKQMYAGFPLLEALNDKYAWWAGPYDSSTVFVEYIGLKDKNGVEIYEHDLIRIKGEMGKDNEYKFDCIYRVNAFHYSGVSLSFVKLYNSEPDSVLNSYPISRLLSFELGSLCVDYVNKLYDNIAIHQTHYKGIIEHQYSNDILVIGNIYQNPELLQP